MEIAYKGSECGTVSCIGGTMAILMGKGEDDAVDYVSAKFRTGGLGDLFYPPDEIDYGTITSGQAVQAIDNFLKNGKPRWRSILAQPKKGKGK